jgi:hypothetical protein
MMPSKQQLEAAERLSDDGSQVFAVIERVRLASEASRNVEVDDVDAPIA